MRFAANARAGVRGSNGFAGNPPLRGLVPFLELAVEVVGEIDPASGYLLNIKSIDEAVLSHALPSLERAAASGNQDAFALLPGLLDGLARALPVELSRVSLRLSPYHALEMHADTPETVLLRLQFDFAASHRLHVAAWSDEQNTECFGKCNNPNGHGHNYRLEPRVCLPAAGEPVSADALERVVHERVIERFDHKHLNLDTREFADGSGLIPSVENIACVCFGLLEGPVAALGPGVRLQSVRVWETDRTSAEFPA